VLREFVFFDQDVIRKEFECLPDGERARLVSLMQHYEQVGLGNPSPVMIDDYGDGIKRLRHIKPVYAGRGLFFCVESRSRVREVGFVDGVQERGPRRTQKCIVTGKGTKGSLRGSKE